MAEKERVEGRFWLSQRGRTYEALANGDVVETGDERSSSDTVRSDNGPSWLASLP